MPLQIGVHQGHTRIRNSYKSHFSSCQRASGYETSWPGTKTDTDLKHCYWQANDSVIKYSNCAALSNTAKALVFQTINIRDIDLVNVHMKVNGFVGTGTKMIDR